MKNKICEHYIVRPKNKILREFFEIHKCALGQSIKGAHMELLPISNKSCPFQNICKYCQLEVEVYNISEESKNVKILRSIGKTIRIHDDGSIQVNTINHKIVFIESLPALYKAVEISKKMVNKNGTK